VLALYFRTYIFLSVKVYKKLQILRHQVMCLSNFIFLK